jgi:hypothetical protein
MFTLFKPQIRSFGLGLIVMQTQGVASFLVTFPPDYKKRIKKNGSGAT